MKTHRGNFALRTMAVAVQVALLAMAPTQTAYSETDATVAELTTPDRSIEAGALYTNKDSYKFGEYNGLQEKGTHGILNVDITAKGGEGSALWWSLKGADLGLDTRRLEATGGNQGKFNLQFLYDDLPHRYSDTYQTIFDGVGTRTLTLPASYPAAATRAGSTNNDASALANWNNIQAPNAVSGTAGGGPGYLIPSLMHNENISTKRTKYGVGGSLILSPQLELSANAQREDKKGTKLTGFAFVSSSTAGMFAEPIDFHVDRYNVSVAFKGDKANVSLAYDYSTFKNSIDAWTAQTPFAGLTTSVGVYNNQGLFSSAPDNQMRQWNLKAGYRFAPSTRLTVDLTKSRMTQNDTFNCETGVGSTCLSGQNGWVIPVNSPDAKVDTETWFVKLSSRAFRNLNLNASIKHDKRDNRTPVNTFTVNFADAGAAAAAEPIANDPISSTRNLVNLDGEYGFAPAQVIKLGYQRESISRTTSGSGYAPSRFLTTANTVDFSLPTHKTHEGTWTVEYRNTAVTDLATRLAYSEAKRSAEDFANPTLTDTTVTNSLTNPYYRSFRHYFVADRKQEKLRGSLNYQMTPAVGLGFTGDHNRDKYDDAALTEVKSTIFNFDLSYTPNENLSITPYYTYEDRKSRLTGKYISTSTTAATKLDGLALVATHFDGTTGGACNVVTGTGASACILINTNWALQQADRVDTLGVGIKRGGFLAGKLDLSGDLLYIRSVTPVTASGGGAVVSDGAAAPNLNYTSLAPLSFPDITSKTTQVRVTAAYKLDKSRTVRANYMYQRLRSSDWQYDLYTNPIAMQSFIGTGMTSSNYSVSAIGVSYQYSFK